MKYQLRITLLSLISFAACSHHSNLSNHQSESKWMDQEDYVRYVNNFSRTPSNTGSQYNIIGDCDGLPRVDVKTAPGFCLGQVFDGVGLRKPRTAAEINEKQIVLTDMGSWNPYDGKIFMVNFENKNSILTEIFSKKSFLDLKDPRREIINLPHQITKHTDGLYYVGTSTAILRFDPLASNPIDTIEILISNLPHEGLHPLKSFVFDDNNGIFVNVGAATNVCNKSVFKKNCEEAENVEIGQGQIRRYQIATDGSISPKFEVYAKGLRNSVALVWDSEKKLLIQGENSRDAISKSSSQLDEATLPHDEINIVEKGKHYGWPYCYDKNLNSPEWKNIKCETYQKPYLLLPAHSAPLSFHIYQGDLFPNWYKGRVLTTLHGYESFGHRIVTFKRDDKGLPTGVPQSIVYGWNAKGEQKFGSPVGITELSDGSLIVVEDNSQKVLRLSYNQIRGDGVAVQEIDKASKQIDIERANLEEARRLKLAKKIAEGNNRPFTLFQNKVIDKTCFSCHGGENAPGIQLLRYDDEGNEQRIAKANKARELYSMVSGESGFPPMPPQGFSSAAEAQEATNLLKLWLEQIDAE